MRIRGDVAVVVVGPAGVVAFRTVVRVRQSLDGRAGFVVARQGREVAVAVIGDAAFREPAIGGRRGPEETHAALQAPGEVVGVGEGLGGGGAVGGGAFLLLLPLGDEAGLAGHAAGGGVCRGGVEEVFMPGGGRRRGEPALEGEMLRCFTIPGAEAKSIKKH